jgi:hypothetical protein
MECDGIISEDRTPKFNTSDIALIRKANELLIGKPVACTVLPPLQVVAADERAEVKVDRLPRWMTTGGQ